MGLADVVKKVADVFSSSSAPGVITNAAQYGAKKMGGIGGDMFGQASNMMSAGGDLFGGAMRQAGGDMFGGAMKQAGGNLFGGAMRNVGGQDLFGSVMGQRNTNPFGSAMSYTGRNPWSTDTGFSPRWDREKQEEAEANRAWLEEQERIRNEGGTGAYTGTTSGLTGGDPNKAQHDKIKGTNQWDGLIQKAAEESGVPASIIKGLMAIESGGNATIGTNTSGATGLMQVVGSIWQGTADRFGSDLNDPWTNIRTGAEVLMTFYKQYGSWEAAIAAYLGSPQVDANGNYIGPGTVADSFGTTGQMYLEIAKNNIAWIESQTGGGYSGEANQWAGNVLGAANAVLGTPYVWGGANTSGFDCSGLVIWAYNQAGNSKLDRGWTSQRMYNELPSVDFKDLKAGDLVLYHFPGGQAGANHVAIYDGKGGIIHATSNGSAVRKDASTFASGNIIGYRRVT